jgi:uncharacterized protein (DUF2267 family)
MKDTGLEPGRGRSSSAPRARATADISLRGRLRAYAAADVATLDARLGELEREWDLERVLEASTAVIGLTSLGLSAARRITTAWLPATLFTVLLQHAMQGWAPPVSLLRSLGYRTRKEIEEETFGVKLLRGDFEGVPSPADAAPETRAFRAWEALKESRDAGRRPAQRAPAPRTFRLGERSTWLSWRRKTTIKAKPHPAQIVPSDIRAENFLAHVRSKWMPDNDEHMDTALRAVLAHLKWRLSAAEAEPLFAHLPKSIARAAQTETPHGYALGEPSKRSVDADAFFDEIALETGMPRREVQQATTAIFSSMKRQLPASQNRALRAMLPKGLKRVWLHA